MKNIRHILSVLLIALVVAMAAGTVVEMRHGNDYALSHVYGSWWFVALWALLALGIIVMMIVRKSWKRPVVCALHSSVLLILLGALLTMTTGQHGEMTLQPHVDNKQFTIEKHGESRIEALPFSLTLDRFEVETYPGTHTPMDFVSYLQIRDGGTTTDAKISMNNILKYRHYRFYQSDYDEEGNSVLSVAHDPWGVGVTYAGYLLLLVALIGMFFERNGQFRTLLRKASASASVLLALFLTVGAALPASAANKPRTLPRESADKMGQMYVMYKGRVCPLQTLAKDFTTKLYGNARYRGYTPEQVFSGWLFYTSDWQNEPIPRIERDLKRGKQREAEEKKQIINMLLNSQLLKIYPHADSAQQVTWYSQNDQLPLEIPDDEYLFIRKQMSLCKEYVVLGDFAALNELFEKTKIYQEKYSLGQVQPKVQYRAERIYNQLSVGRWLAMVTITLGLICFAVALICLGKGRKLYRPVRVVAVVWMSLLCVFLALVFILRWIAGGHVPMAGSFDSMNLLALSICIITLIITIVETRHGTSLQDTGNKYEMALPAGLLMTGIVLLVQMMGGSNPPITHLMPVLSSPLLSLHVTVIMIAYALLFFIMLNGISAVIVRLTQPTNTQYLDRLRNISLIMLYPAVALLAAGIFIGAVWANISWGNYWSWDPKEVWALITLLVYIAPLHSTLWKSFQKPLFFHLYSILAFLSVLITYFGVNFLLGGMHSYN
ncbi:MAG: cytochrome c biogenesis protein CcsA [Prevotella sp.]|nr:cytochrome c biogenesis protein CcsA [Prevotella sp.]MBR0527797.1 cytochrome c biogenesis protein CcsA [Prevotella sp.]